MTKKTKVERNRERLTRWLAESCRLHRNEAANHALAAKTLKQQAKTIAALEHWQEALIDDGWHHLISLMQSALVESALPCLTPEQADKLRDAFQTVLTLTIP